MGDWRPPSNSEPIGTRPGLKLVSRSCCSGLRKPIVRGSGRSVYECGVPCLVEKTRLSAQVRSAFVFAPLFSDIDSKLLGFLVKMAALEAERLRGVGHVEAGMLQLREYHFAFKALYAFG